MGWQFIQITVAVSTCSQSGTLLEVQLSSIADREKHEDCNRETAFFRRRIPHEGSCRVIDTPAYHRAVVTRLYYAVIDSLCIT